MNLEMELDFKYLKLFKDQIDLAELNSDINLAMFCFGLQLGTKESGHTTRLRQTLNTVSPFLPLFKDLWDVEELRKIQNGSDEVNEVAELPDGILFLVNQIETTKNYNRSTWSYFYLFGYSTGLVNSNEIKSSEYQYFISLMPDSFLVEQKERLEILSEKFSITSFTVAIVIDKNNQNIYLQPKKDSTQHKLA